LTIRTNWQTRHFDDLQFTVLYAVDTYVVDFRAYQIASIGEVPRWYLSAQDGMTDQLIYAESEISGSVKWDSCSNWNLGPPDCMAHFCGYDTMQRFGLILLEMYKIAATHFNNEFFEDIPNGPEKA
jgi:hypothetical protein